MKIDKTLNDPKAYQGHLRQLDQAQREILVLILKKLKTAFETQEGEVTIPLPYPLVDGDSVPGYVIVQEKPTKMKYCLQPITEKSCLIYRLKRDV